MNTKENTDKNTNVGAQAVDVNTEKNTTVHCLEGLIVVVHEEKQLTPQTDGCASEGDVTVRGDELKEAAKLQHVAEKLEGEHMDQEAQIVKDHVRDMVAKQLNEFDGFDR